MAPRSALRRLTFVLVAPCLACGSGEAPEPTAPGPGIRTYQQDLDVLEANVQVVELSDDDGQARVAIVPAYQGRVMTSTAGGGEGSSQGWINEELITSSRRGRPSTWSTGRPRRWSTPSPSS